MPGGGAASVSRWVAEVNIDGLEEKAGGLQEKGILLTPKRCGFTRNQKYDGKKSLCQLQWTKTHLERQE